MFCRHVFGNISGGFRGNTWISRVRDRVKYQKPCWAKKALRITFSLNSTHLIRTPLVRMLSMTPLVSKLMGCGCTLAKCFFLTLLMCWYVDLYLEVVKNWSLSFSVTVFARSAQPHSQDCLLLIQQVGENPGSKVYDYYDRCNHREVDLIPYNL